MDILQIFGDYIHLLGMFILLIKLCLTKNCAGVSGKTQVLNAIVFSTRYTDLMVVYISLYNTIMKIIHISIIYCTVLSMFFFRKTYDRKRDAFRMELLILPSAVLGLFLTENLITIKILWTFSIFLEAVSIVPQIYMVSKSKQVESIIVSYISCFGLHQGFYLMHWFYKYLKIGYLDKTDKVLIASGIIQLIFYCDFFARNLPILKRKNCVNGPLANDTTSTDDVQKVDVGDKVINEIDTQTSITTSEEYKNMHSVIVLPSNSLDNTEKIALLNSKNQSK